MYFWFIVAAALMLVEMATLGLTTIWFAAGAIAAGFLRMAGLELWVQITAFVLVSLLLLLMTRPWASRYLNSHTEKTNADSLIGLNCLTLTDIDNLTGSGSAMVRGLEWSAGSVTDGMIIPAGTKVRIVSISGVKLIVEPVEE